MPQHLYGIVPRQKKGLAVAGLVLGVLSVVSFYFACVSVVLAVVGLVLSIKAIKRKTARDIAITGLVASLLGLLLVIAFVAFVTVGWNNKGVWNGIGTCGSRIYSIGRAVEIYRAENADQYPPNLEALIQDHAFYYGRELPRCPLDGSSEGTSYFYCAPWNGPNAQEGAPATNCIIACEVMAAHPVTGFFGPDESNKRRHILWSDGTIELYTESEFQQELQQPENRRFAREFAKGIQMTPQERVTYIAPRDGE
jgi:hypothetical protein